MKRLLILLVIIGVIIVFSPAAYSEVTESGVLGVSAVVEQECVVAAGHLNFGIYNNGSGNDKNGNVRVKCSDQTNYEIALGSGFDPVDNGNFREMTLNGNHWDDQRYLKYSLMKEDREDWGSGNGDEKGDRWTGEVGNGLFQDHTLIGNVPPNQAGHAPQGGYADVVEVTVIIEPD